LKSGGKKRGTSGVRWGVDGRRAIAGREKKEEFRDKGESFVKW